MNGTIWPSPTLNDTATKNCKDSRWIFTALFFLCSLQDQFDMADWSEIELQNNGGLCLLQYVWDFVVFKNFGGCILQSVWWTCFSDRVNNGFSHFCAVGVLPDQLKSLVAAGQDPLCPPPKTEGKERWMERRGDRCGGERQTGKVTADTTLWQGQQMLVLFPV